MKNIKEKKMQEQHAKKYANSCTLASEPGYEAIVLQCEKDGALYIYLHIYIIPTLFAYFLACHPYILLNF